MSAYKFNGMMEWYDKHHAHRFIQKMPNDVHYGAQQSKGQEVHQTYNIHGHTITLWKDGLLTCNCMGWIMKRVGKERECTHVRSIYAELNNKPKPEKRKPMIKELAKDKDWELYQEFLAFQKLMKGGR
jgi:hypothetical protein